MSQLTEFYLGTGTDSEGRSLVQLWNQSDQEMEYHHDFIQWLFPLTEPSQFNPDAPLVTDSDIREFRGNPLLQEHLLRSFDRFLGFLGLARDGTNISPASDFKVKQWRLTRPNHNWLRITRVLHCLNLLGLGPQARAFFQCLLNLAESGQAQISTDTFAYWKNAAFPVSHLHAERGTS